MSLLFLMTDLTKNKEFFFKKISVNFTGGHFKRGKMKPSGIEQETLIQPSLALHYLITFTYYKKF